MKPFKNFDAIMAKDEKKHVKRYKDEETGLVYTNGSIFNDDTHVSRKSVRRFLNMDGHHGIASICITLTGIVNGYGEDEIQIADCNRMITLSLDSANGEEIANSVHKIRMLIEALCEAEDVYMKKASLVDEFKVEGK